MDVGRRGLTPIHDMIRTNRMSRIVMVVDRLQRTRIRRVDDNICRLVMRTVVLAAIADFTGTARHRICVQMSDSI
jgi:hypothetical protein